MRRGEVWRVSGLAGDRTMLIIGNNALMDLYSGVQCVEIDTSRTARETLVTVNIERLINPHTSFTGTALAAGTGPVLRKRFEERLGEADPDTMERIAIALRAVYDLP